MSSTLVVSTIVYNTNSGEKPSKCVLAFRLQPESPDSKEFRNANEGTYIIDQIHDNKQIINMFFRILYGPNPVPYGNSTASVCSTEFPLLNVQFPTLLGKLARYTAARSHAVSASITIDPVTFPKSSTRGHLTKQNS